MSYFVFGIFRNRVHKPQKDSMEIDRISYESYMDEYKRLENLREDSENIWEERTYQLSAGGLSLTFAVFSFLIEKAENNHFKWPMGVIWSVYTFCLVVNYISHRISISNFSKYIKRLDDDRFSGKDYNERVLIERYQCGDRLVRILNTITEILLIFNVVFTIIYSFFFFCNI